MASNGSRTTPICLRRLARGIDGVSAMAHSEASIVDVDRIRSLLGGEQLRRLVHRLRKRMSRGETLTGKIHLAAASPSERAEIDKLLGRLPTRGDSLTVDLDKL